MLEPLLYTAQTLPFLEGDNLPGFISSIYSFALTIVGIAVFVQILRAGFKWLTAAGNSGKAGEGKRMMTNAVTGAILLFAAYMILFIINPDLVNNTFNFRVPPKTSSGISGQITLSTTTEATLGTAVVSGVPSSGAAFHKGSPVAHAQAGLYFFGVKVTDSNGETYQQNYQMELVPRGSAPPPFNPAGNFSSNIEGGSLKILTTALPGGVVGQPYQAEIAAVGGQTPYVYSIGSGFMPDGLSIQATWETPILTIENLTAQRNPSYSFREGDRYRIILSNAQPDMAIDIFSQKDGVITSWPGVGESRTDENGAWVQEGSLAVIGSWNVWTVVDNRISNITSFQVVGQFVITGTSGDINALTPTSTRGSYNFTPCTTNNFCEVPETGERFEPGPGGCQGDGYTGPEGTRQVVECLYPEDNRNDICREFDLDWRNCSSQVNDIRITEDGERTGALDTSQITQNQEDAPAGTLFTADPTFPGSTDRILRCSYGTQNQQFQAIICGYPASGIYCLIGSAPEGCLWLPAEWDADEELQKLEE